MPKQVDDETREIISSFIAEGYERLDDAEVQLGKLGDGDDRSRLNSVFRLFHSVKGSAGYLNFERIKALTHEAEALLEVFIKGGVDPTQESLDVVFGTIDVLRELIKLVERELDDEAGADRAVAQAKVVADCVAGLKTSPPPAAGKVEPRPAPEPAVAEPPNELELSELVTRDMVERFIVESADLADSAEKNALLLGGPQAGPDTLNDIFRAVHTIKGNAGFFGYLLLESRCMEFESFMDAARKGASPINEAFASGIMHRVDALRAAMGGLKILEPGQAGREAEAADPAPATPPPAASAPSPSPEPERRVEAPPRQPLPEAEPPVGSPISYKPIGEILVDMGAAREEEVRSALETQAKPLGELLLERGAVKPEELQSALEAQKKAAGPDRPQVEEVQRKEIRVDTAKLDKLFDLVGELITAEAMVGNSPDLAGLKLDHFQKAFAGLGKISREIQETTMMIRMIPLEGLFQKMTRLVRDLSRKFEKPVDFVVTGAETEMDKNVIEQISDPLVHILRNALDHGLEPAAARRSGGKAETGTLHLDARYEGSEIWISVKDDGAGLNKEKIMAKAVQKGLVLGDPALVSDADAYALIFEPGFSTADKVSEISGRGVGLDVVKKNLERIRGRVDIKTEKGQGTEFILKIPLTMAIIDGITVRAGRSYYSIPLNDILEFFKATPNQLTVTEKGEETLNLRGSIMPLVKLGEAFNIADAIDDPTEGIILVVQSAGRRACVLIDEVVGNQQIVVKSLSEYLGKVEGVSGCSILGDGTVSFIVDTARLIGRRIE